MIGKDLEGNDNAIEALAFAQTTCRTLRNPSLTNGG
jgi:hypothetical protein